MGARFSAPFQTGPGAHFYTTDTGSFTGLKRRGRDLDHPPPPNAEVKESTPPLGFRGEIQLYIYFPIWQEFIYRPRYLIKLSG